MNDYKNFPELLKAIKNTMYESISLADCDFTPTRTVKHFAPPADGIHAVRIFIEAIDNLVEFDYGDFMRKANTYICNLRSHLAGCKHEVLDLVNKMQFYTQFVPSWQIEPTRRRLLEDSLKLLRMLKVGESSVREPKGGHVPLAA